jgi:purine-nucleoside/S-methyl-5'-thioadenosine phosphorylase / adenosine deaminase
MWRIRETSIGRVVVPAFVPEGFAVFCTTIDFDGKLTDGGAESLTRVAEEQFGVRAALNTCRQIHSATAVHAISDSGWHECDSCDALWSDRPHVALGIKIADCLPVSILDPASGSVANIHSGWRGTVQKITRATLAAVPMNACDAYAFLGPSIRVCCFEVGEEVVDQFQESFGDVTRYVDRSLGPKPHVNVVALTIDVLREAGFRPEHVDDSELCTRCDGSIFHSFRRDGGRGGRNLALVAR